MYYTIYKITNQIDGKFYIGAHKTQDLNDSYMGSGKYLIYAQNKYGIENFKKEILFVYDNQKEMYEKEAELVTEELIATKNTYNLKPGGYGGFDYETSKKAGIKCRDLKLGFHGYTHEQRSLMSSENLKKYYENGGVSSFTYLNQSKDFREKINKKLKEIDHQKGEKNSQYGTKWIHNEELKMSKKIKKEEDIPEGWKLGRKLKFTGP